MRARGAPTISAGPPLVSLARSWSAASTRERNAGAAHQVLRRIAGQRQLGGHDQIRACRAPLLVGIRDLGRIGRNGADGGVELGKTDCEGSAHVGLWRSFPANSGDNRNLLLGWRVVNLGPHGE